MCAEERLSAWNWGRGEGGLVGIFLFLLFYLDMTWIAVE